MKSTAARLDGSTPPRIDGAWLAKRHAAETPSARGDEAVRLRAGTQWISGAAARRRLCGVARCNAASKSRTK
jgi:hypothetical protein